MLKIELNAREIILKMSFRKYFKNIICLNFLLCCVKKPQKKTNPFYLT